MEETDRETGTWQHCFVLPYSRAGHNKTVGHTFSKRTAGSKEENSEHTCLAYQRFYRPTFLLWNVFYRESPDGVGACIFRDCCRHLANRFVKHL